METLLLSNLAKLQSFDAALQRGKGLDALAAKYSKAIMLQPNSKRRATAIEKLQLEVVKYFEQQVQPAAQKLGTNAARAVLHAIPQEHRASALNNPDLRRRVLIEGNLRTRDRIRIVRALVQDNSNTLHNRLLAFWLEPGLKDKQKLGRLVEVHTQMVEAQAKYDEALSKYHAGEGSRPRKPNVDFLALFQQDTKQDLREQARRAGTDAETTTFVAAGHEQLTWVTVNASQACPDCKERQGKSGDLKFWDSFGKPGAGKTVCGASCYCLLVPEETVKVAPGLARGLETPTPVKRAIPKPPEASQTSQKSSPKKPKPIAPPPFPEPTKLSSLKEIKALSGSTGAKLVEDEHGQQFVMKRGSSPDHLREEFHAEEAYRALGIDVPASNLYDDGASAPVKLSKFIPGRVLKDIPQDAPDFKKAVKKLQRGFAADATLGNWDVAGAGLDNVLVGEDGKVYRIDTGGALRFRAQGKPKGNAFGENVVELWSLQDPKVNKDSAAVFSTVKHDEKMAQLQGVLSKRDALLNALPKGELRDRVSSRLDDLKRISEIDTTLSADRWAGDYRGLFAKHTTQLRAEGFVNAMPSRLRASGSDRVTLIDENGKPFDDLRGSSGLTAKLASYVDRIGGRYSVVTEYGSAQAGTSWSKTSMAMKHFLAGSRDVPDSSYHWEDGREAAKRAFTGVLRNLGGTREQNERIYAETIAAQHAFTFELLGKTDMPHNDRRAGVVQLIRTETKAVMELYGLKRGQKDVRVTRGALESTSIFTTVTVKGRETTVQNVPHHRVFATYLQSRGSEHRSFFIGDHENEFTAMLEGLSVDYVLPGR
jgi:hypothetical protein